MRFATVDLHAAEMAFMAFVDLSEGAPAEWHQLSSRLRKLQYPVSPSRPRLLFLSPGKNWVDVDVRHYEARELTYIVGRQGIGVSLGAKRG